MTMRDWIQRYADRMEEASIDWHSLIDRRKWNGLEGGAQDAYEEKLKKRAERPQYRAWRGDVFYQISKDDYLWAKQRGIGSANRVRTNAAADRYVLRFLSSFHAEAFVEDANREIGPSVARIKPRTVASVLLDVAPGTDPEVVERITRRYAGVVSERPVAWKGSLSRGLRPTPYDPSANRAGEAYRLNYDNGQVSDTMRSKKEAVSAYRAQREYDARIGQSSFGLRVERYVGDGEWTRIRLE